MNPLVSLTIWFLIGTTVIKYSVSRELRDEIDTIGSSDDKSAEEDNLDQPWLHINFISPKFEVSQAKWWFDNSIGFHAKGMEHLYLLTQLLMNWIQPPGMPPGFIKEELFDNPVEHVKENQLKLFTHFWGIILTSTIAICLSIIVPLLGFLLCCCCCKISSSNQRAKHTHNRDPVLYITSSSSSAGSPGHQAKKKKPKYKIEKGLDSCSRSICSITLFIILLLVSFFVICAFVTNEYVHNGVNQLPRTLNQSLDDIKLYLNKTQFEVNTLLRTNFRQLEQELDNSLDRSGIIVKNRLAQHTKAISLENLTAIVSKLDDIHRDLTELSDHTNILKTDVRRIAHGLENKRQSLENVLRNCRDPICINLEQKYRSKLSRFQISTKLNNLPDLSPVISNISQLLKAGIVNEVLKGKSSFDRISFEIQQAVNGTIPEIKKQIRLVGRDLSSTADDINNLLDLPNEDIENGKHNIDVGSQFLIKYDVYRNLGCLGGTTLVFTIMLAYSIGLLCGVCKKQPTYHEYRSRRVKPPTSCPFRFGICHVFLLFAVLMLATIIFFITGSVVDRVGCYYLEHPEEPQTRQLMAILQRKLDDGTISKSIDQVALIRGIKPNIADVISRCHQNSSLYNVLQPNKYNSIQLPNNKIIAGFNLSNVLEFKGRYKIETRLRRLLDNVNFDPSTIVILTHKATSLLERLKDSNLDDLNFSSFSNAMYQKITPLDLHNISIELKAEAKKLPTSQISYSAELADIGIIMDGYHDQLKEVQDSLSKLNRAAQKIKDKSSYGSRGLRDALTILIKQAKSAQYLIEKNGKNAIKEDAEHFINDLGALIDQYAQHVYDQVESQLGRCEPVSRAINATTIAICKEIVLPYNGYWFSMGSAILLLLPATLSASILANLFRKLKRPKARRHLDLDADVTLENFEEDDIPLAQVVKQTDIPYEARRNPPMYQNSSAPSAPHSEENWITSATSPPHMYTRPPPYNFNN